MIQTDAKGERRFFHWRESAAARQSDGFARDRRHPAFAGGYDVVYLSAITLSISARAGRGRLIAALRQRAGEEARALPSTPIFAPAAGPIWMSRERCFGEAFEAADIVLASTEDLLPLYPGESDEQPDGAHSGRGGRDEARRARKHRSRRGRGAAGEGRARDEARRRYHRGRRQFCRRLYRRTARRRRSGANPPVPGTISPASSCAIPVRSFHVRPCRQGATK